MSVKVKWTGNPTEVTVTNSYGTIESDQFEWGSAPVNAAVKVYLLSLEQEGQPLSEELQNELLETAANPQENCWDLTEWELFDQNKEVFGRSADVWLSFESTFSNESWQTITSADPTLLDELKSSGMVVTEETSL